MQRYKILENAAKKCKASNSADNYQSIYQIITYEIYPLTDETDWDMKRICRRARA